MLVMWISHQRHMYINIYNTYKVVRKHLVCKIPVVARIICTQFPFASVARIKFTCVND